MTEKQLQFQKKRDQHPKGLEKRIYILNNDMVCVWKTEKDKLSLNPKIEPYMIITMKRFKEIFPFWA